MVGQFKDDQLQRMQGAINQSGIIGSAWGVMGGERFTESYGENSNGSFWSSISFDSARMARSGDVTRTKQKGVKYIIKVL